MKSTILTILALTSLAGTTHADVPNKLRPKMSSSTITKVAVKCILKSDTARVYGRKFCSCIMDSVRSRSKDSDKTVVDLCETFAYQTAKNSSVLRSPYHGSLNWPTRAIVINQLECATRLKKSSFSGDVDKECGCATDLYRKKVQFPKWWTKRSTKVFGERLVRLRPEMIKLCYPRISI